MAEGTAENSTADIVERALAILDEETRAWVIGQRAVSSGDTPEPPGAEQPAEQPEGGPDA